ncbi:SoxR reducing system RseC family protein [Crenobacter cavernae]|uniref:Sigma E positive regulator RseC/MucC n=1 Tax=Crenobacter cavernae TaxID=2290923 RepID=A0ABY0FDL9_9NEIS|nr:SoxR reducing system RseC family protein [Crenobacter cavernae]RXZ44280.1 sigma E positive regulator RseC/MucC [Crenobacter cavernae]
MIETQARVVKADAGSAWVEPRPHSPCGQCDPETGCRTLNIARLFRNGAGHFRVADPLGVSPGDWVTVGVPEEGMLKSALVVYLVPLAGLFAGAALGAPAGEFASVCAAALGFSACLLGVKRFGRRADAALYTPTIIAKFDRSSVPQRKPCRSRS